MVRKITVETGFSSFYHSFLNNIVLKKVCNKYKILQVFFML